jgi:hypothetical protein
MKSLSESRVSLDIRLINATVKLIFHSFMSHVKKKLSVLSVLFGLEFLSVGFFTNGTFSWITHPVPPLPKAVSHAHARAVKLDSPAETDGRFVLESDGEPKPRSATFLTTNDPAQVFLRSFVVVPFFFRIILTPKVSRYISKSVLNL